MGEGRHVANDVQPDRHGGVHARLDWSAYALLFGRICFAADFMLFGARKFANPSIIYKLIEAHHLPGALVYPTIVLQFGCGLLVLLGLQTRLAAAALGWFCIVAPSIFWLDTLEHLSRDYAAAGGFMLLVLFGPGPLSLDARLRHPRRRRFAHAEGCRQPDPDRSRHAGGAHVDRVSVPGGCGEKARLLCAAARDVRDGRSARRLDLRP